MEVENHHPLRRYAVFISYRHADNKESGRQWATWLHQVLEGYEIPKDLVGTKNSKGDLIPASLYPVFRDEEELPADADLTKNIRQALENSGLLVVLCSPRAVESRFVADEIRYFKELGKADRILALMIDGEPNAADDPGKIKLGIKPESECLPEPLRYGVVGDGEKINWSRRAEPIAADARPEGRAEQGWTTGAAYREALHKAGGLGEDEITRRVHAYEQRLQLATLKVVAGALGVPLGILTQRDKAMQLEKARKRARTLKLWLAAVGLLAMLAIAGGIYARVQRQEAIAQQQVAEARRKEALQTLSQSDFLQAQRLAAQDNRGDAIAFLSRSLIVNPKNVAAMIRLLNLLAFHSWTLPVCSMAHNSATMYAEFSPDGRMIATASCDSSARIWDAQTGKPLTNPLNHNGAVYCARFSPDGTRVVTASDDKTARIWDVQTGKSISVPIQHDGPVITAEFSPDGKMIVTASLDDTVRVWDSQNGNPLGTVMDHGDKLLSARFSPDGTRLVSASSGNSAKVWDVRSGKLLIDPLRHNGGTIHSAEFSPDGKYAVTTSEDGTAIIWNLITGAAVGEPMKHGNEVFFAQFSPDGKRIVTASYDNTARVWDASSGKPLTEPMKHNGKVWRAEFSPDGRRIVTASWDNTARVWDATTGESLTEPLKHAGMVWAAKFSPDGKQIVTASSDNLAQVWSTELLPSQNTILKSFGHVWFAQFSPDGKKIATSSQYDRSLTLWDAETGLVSVRAGKSTGESGIWFAQFSPDGKQIVTASSESRIWDTQSGQPLKSLLPSMPADFIQFSPDGRWILTWSATTAEARVWNAQTGEPRSEIIKHQADIEFADFSPDGKWVVTASRDNSAKVWDAQTGKPLPITMQHDGPVTSAHFSPDGKQIVTSSDDNTARIWDAHTGKLLIGPMKHGGTTVFTAEYSPDGKHIITTSDDNTAQIWSALTGLPSTVPIKHDAPVKSAHYSADGQRIVTASDDGTAKVWDAQTGQLLAEPLLHKNVVLSARFSPHGKRILTASMDGTARVMDIAPSSTAFPDWVPHFVEAVSGQILNSQSVLEPIKGSRIAEINMLRNSLNKTTNNDDWTIWGRWLMSASVNRTISPLSKITISEFISQHLEQNTPESVEEAYRIDPGNPLIVASLAKFEEDKDRALFLCRHALKRARIEGPPEKIEQVRSIAKALFPDLTEFHPRTPKTAPNPH